MLVPCGQCGEKISPRAAVCPRCGEPIGSSIAPDPRLRNALKACRRNSAYPGFRRTLNWLLALSILGAILGPWIAYHEAGLRQSERVEAAETALVLNIALLPLVSVAWYFFHTVIDIADSLLRRDLHGSPGTVARDALD